MKWWQAVNWWVVAVIVTCVGGLVLLVVSMNGPVHQANIKEFNRNAAKVEKFCGRDAAGTFRAIYDPDDDSEGPMQEWVTRCKVGRPR